MKTVIIFSGVLAVCLSAPNNLGALTHHAAPLANTSYSYAQPSAAFSETGHSSSSAHGSSSSSASSSHRSSAASSHSSSALSAASLSHSSSASASSQHSAAAGTSSAVAVENHGPVIEIITDERVGPDETGHYSFTIEGSDGSHREETGSISESGTIVQTGSYSYTLPDGEIFELKFVADENGFQPESPYLLPLPEYILEQIAFAKSHPESEADHSSVQSAASSGSHRSSSSSSASHSLASESSGHSAGAATHREAEVAHHIAPTVHHEAAAPAQSYLTPN